MVKRLVFILLIVLLPIQMTWAAVSVYCTHHEEGNATQHFGHHDDEHEEIATDNNDNSQPDSQKTAEQSHGHHHHGGTLGILSSVSLPTHDASSSDTHTELQARISSPPPSQPERPNWRTAT